MSKEYHHLSVLSDEIIEFLQPKSGQNYIDCTLGGGGHTVELLKKTGPAGKVLGFEIDPHACQWVKNNLSKFKERVIIACKSYIHLEEEFKKHQKEFKNISGIILDLGLSSDQLGSTNRGFSFKDHGSLDMRFNPQENIPTASDIVLNSSENELANIFREYGEVKQAKRLSKGIIAWRKEFVKQKQKSLETSMFVSAILRILGINPSSLPRFRIHPATQVFQALRIAVNQELDNLQQVLPQAINILPSGGRLAVISFHSLEDRIVKHYFKELAQGCICPPNIPICRCNNQPKIKIKTKRPIRPSAREIAANPRSRSASLRVIEKI